MKRSVAIAVAVMLSACTAVRVKPVEVSQRPTLICVVDNPKVIVPNFVSILIERIDYHGIDAVIVQPESAMDCETRMTYTALQSWDMVTYLADAELMLWRGNKLIGSANYHLKGGGGLSFSKYASTKSKMDPVIDELLGGKDQ